MTGSGAPPLATGMPLAELPFADAGRWPPVLTCVLALPAAHADRVRADGRLQTTVGKVVCDRRGSLGIAVDLPDVHGDTPALAHACAAAALAGRSPPPPRDAVDRLLRELLHAARAAGRLDVQCAGDAARCVLRGAAAAFVLEWTDTELALMRPRLLRIPRAAVLTLRRHAERLASVVQLARLEVGDDWCGFAVRLPLADLREPAAPALASAVWMSCHALVALERSQPPLPALADPGFMPLLELAAVAEPARAVRVPARVSDPVRVTNPIRRSR